MYIASFTFHSATCFLVSAQTEPSAGVALLPQFLGLSLAPWLVLIAPPSHTPVDMTENPVLNPSELKAHLNLLRAFHDMRSKVKDGSKLGLDVHTLSPEVEWKSFVQASVERYIV